MDIISNNNFINTKYENKLKKNPILSTDVIQDSTEKIENLVITEDNFFNAPWIYPNYFSLRQKKGENILIKFYVTDYLETEYRLNDYSKRFQIEINFNGNIIRRVFKGGDNEMYIGSCNTLGATHFTIQATDLQNNIKSFKYLIHLYIEDSNFEYNTYTMTENDLTTYSLNNTGSTEAADMTNNIDGLNRFFQELVNNGYNRLLMLPNGDYRVNPGNTRNRSIVLPSHFTLDMNGSMIKQEYTENGSQSLVLSSKAGSIDVHLMNGKIWGDYDKHPNTVGSSEGEGFNLIYPGNAFSSIENMDIGWCTGYTLCSSLSSRSKMDISSFTHCYINNNGEEIESNIMVTSNFVNLNKLEYKYLSFNKYLGYGGIRGNSDIAYVHFYDSDQKYISSTKIRQFALFERPENAMYVRGTLLAANADADNNLSDYPSFEGTNYFSCTGTIFKNLHIHDTRTCGMATGVMNFMLVENCTFSRSGKGITPIAIDIEDGYQYGQNYFFRNNNILDRSGTGDLIITSGYNHQLENNNFRVDIRGSKGLVLRGGQYNKVHGIVNKGFTKTGFHRIENCIFREKIESKIELGSHANPSYKNIFKNCIMYNGVYIAPSKLDDQNNSEMHNCIIIDEKEETNKHWNLIAKDCEIKLGNGNYLFNSCNKFYKCTFNSYNNSLRSTLWNKHGGLCENCNFNKNITITGDLVNSDDPLIFKKCTFQNATINRSYWNNGVSLIFKECTINHISGDSALVDIGQWFLYGPITFEDCTINLAEGKYLGKFDDNRINNNRPSDLESKFITFKNCTINNSGITKLLTGLYDKNPGDNNILKIHVEGNTIQNNIQWYDPNALGNKVLGESFIFEEV